MAVKTATVNVRVEKSVKEQAEAILDQLGISTSAFINMTYKQVIMRKGIPFDVTIPDSVPNMETLSDEEFNKIMATGLEQAQKGDSIPYEDAFDALLKDL